MMAESWDAAIAQVHAVVQGDIAAAAVRAHAEVMATDPRPINFVRHVDGVEGAPEQSVRPDGIIVYDYNRLDLIAKDALDLLRKNSPVKSGDYVRGHVLYLNGQAVETLKNWKPGDEISITNYVEYARVIEVGKRGSKTVKFSMPPHVYEKVAQLLRRTYGAYADIQFTYRGLVAGAQINPLQTGAAPLRQGTGGRFVARGGARAHNKSEARYPTITINPAGSFSSRGPVR